MIITKARGLRFLILVIAPAFLLMLTAISINSYVDPYWVMPAMGDRSPLRYCVDDERQNKIDKMIFGGVDADSVLIGSSRSAFFDTRYFEQNVFNLSVNGLRPVEYPEYIRIFTEHVGAPKDIYVGFDFFGYILGQGDTIWIGRAREKANAATSRVYRIEKLLDIGTLNKSIETVKKCSSRGFESVPTYRYDGVRSVSRKPHTPTEISEQVAYFRALYDKKTPVDAQFRTYIERLKQVSPASRIHIYIPPISAELFRTIIAAGRADDYRAWLMLLTEEFGSVVQFSGINSFTSDLDNFYDTHHTYPDLTKKMIEIIQGIRQPDPDGFGQHLTRRSVPIFADKNLPRS